MVEVVIAQSKIRIDSRVDVKPGSEFPRPLEWWQRYVPVWLDASEDVMGNIVLTPNGRIADGRRQEVTPALARRDARQALIWLSSQVYLDFTDALVQATSAGREAA